MLKTLFLACLLIAGGGYYYYNSPNGVQLSEANTHTAAVERFWFNQKQLLVEGHKTDLPFSSDLQTLDYAIGESSIEGGTYYFQTLLVVNNQRMRVDTAVKPNDGIWMVDIEETFMLANLSSLDHYLYSYLESLTILNQQIGKDYAWGMGDGYSEENAAYLNELLDLRFNAVKAEILARYKNNGK